MHHCITYKGIEHETFGDAPFVGARILAAQCSRNCKGCFNQDLKEQPNQFSNAGQLIEEVKRHKLDEGIILGGLEWTEQAEDMMELATLARAEGLLVMIYTGMTEEQFFRNFPEMLSLSIWYKFGAYDEQLKSNCYYSHGVKLSSTNQYVIYVGGKK